MAEKVKEDTTATGDGGALRHISSDNIMRIDPVTGQKTLVKNLLGSDDTIKALAEMVLSSDLEPPLTVGIYSGWGTGKTYFLHSIKAELDKRADEGAAANDGADVVPLTVMFEAWQHQADENILVSMLFAAYQELPKKVRDKKENQVKFLDYAQAAVSVGASLLPTIKAELSGESMGAPASVSAEISPKEAVEAWKAEAKRLADLNTAYKQEMFLEKQGQAKLKDHYDKVIDMLASQDMPVKKKNGKQPRRRIVFFIDDLDRCLPEVVVNLLEKIKLFLWHSDCVFIIGIDQDQVKTAVAEAKHYRDEGIALHYLEKIINFPFHMPPIGGDFYRNFITDKLKHSANKEEIVEIFTAACDERQASLRLMIQLANRYILNELLVTKALAAKKIAYNPQVMAALTALQVLHENAFRQICGRQINRKEALIAFFGWQEKSEASKVEDKLMVYLDADSVAAMDGLREAAAEAGVKETDDLKCYVEFLESQVSASDPASAIHGDSIDPSARIYHFGGYDWRVLALEQGRALLITEEIIERRRFHASSNNWEQSEIETWLNGKFLDSFNDEQKQRILKVRLDDVGIDDQVFLLSIDQARRYFKDNNDRIARYHGKALWWWLRSPGSYGSDYAAYVYGVGCVDAVGGDVDNDGGVRPALWLNL